MKVNVKEVDIFKKMGNDDGDREGRSQQMTHQANLLLPSNTQQYSKSEYEESVLHFR